MFWLSTRTKKTGKIRHKELAYRAWSQAIAVLIRHRADINLHQRDQAPPLLIATRLLDAAVVEQLLHARADVAVKVYWRDWQDRCSGIWSTPWNGLTALQIAEKIQASNIAELFRLVLAKSRSMVDSDPAGSICPKWTFQTLLSSKPVFICVPRPKNVTHGSIARFKGLTPNSGPAGQKVQGGVVAESWLPLLLLVVLVSL